MKNEPVAYIDPYDLERLPHYDCHIGSQQLKNGIPLYTHPANVTYELTMEKCRELLKENEALKAHPVKELTEETKEALIVARSIAMRMAAEARIPECGDFAKIAQCLDFACDELATLAKAKAVNK